jgi:hypothetical protein
MESDRGFVLDAIRKYVKGAFEGVEPTARVLDQQEEIIADLTEKYDDLVAGGKSQDEALGTVLASVGDLSALAGEFRAAQDKAELELAAAKAKGTGKMPQWAKIVLAIVAVLAGLVVLSGVLGVALFLPVRQVISEVRPKPNGVEEMQIEYRQTAAKLTLPPGVVFPDKANPGPDPDSTVYGEGIGTQRAQFYWLYAWEMEWLTQRVKDPGRAAKAFSVLKNEAPRSDVMTTYLDDIGRNMWQEYVRKAEAGDPSGFQADVEANPFVLATSTAQ